MNILKPQNNHIEKLKSENIINIQETEKITCCNFENEECNNINLYENELQEEYYNIGKQQYRQAYYLALARKDNILAEKLKNGYQRFYQSDIEIV